MLLQANNEVFILCIRLSVFVMAFYVVSPVHNFDCQTNATQNQNAQNENNAKHNQLTIDQILPRNPRHRGHLLPLSIIICRQLRRALDTSGSRGELYTSSLSKRHGLRPNRQLCRQTTRRLQRRQL